MFSPNKFRREYPYLLEKIVALIEACAENVVKCASIPVRHLKTEESFDLKFKKLHQFVKNDYRLTAQLSPALHLCREDLGVVDERTSEVNEFPIGS